MRLIYLSALHIVSYTSRLRTCSDDLTFGKIRKSENHIVSLSLHDD